MAPVRSDDLPQAAPTASAGRVSAARRQPGPATSAGPSATAVRHGLQAPDAGGHGRSASAGEPPGSDTLVGAGAPNHPLDHQPGAFLPGGQLDRSSRVT